MNLYEPVQVLPPHYDGTDASLQLREFAREKRFPEQQHDPLSIRHWWPNVQHGFVDTRTYKGH